MTELRVLEDDISLTDVDDGEAKDQPVPMLLEHSEFQMRDKNEMVCVWITV